MIRSRFRRSPVTMFLLVLALGAFAVSAVWQARPAYALMQLYACYSYVPVYAAPEEGAAVLTWMAQGQSFVSKSSPVAGFIYGREFVQGVTGWAPYEDLCYQP